ncbi:iron ABC transporter permease [Zwartia sp. IMCC34845]|nr:iron ABC transporter permease [Zwartia vadi]MDN3986106.1 iron ABC transporter permease [Zwartia vadi]
MCSLALLSLRAGAIDLSWHDFFALMLGRHLDDPLLQTVLFDLRLPRVLLAVIVGGALALSGAVMQALFRNPLAEPTLVGISAGASLGTVIALLLGMGSVLATGVAGFSGAIFATAIAYVVGRRVPGVAGLLLAGIAINAFALSLVSLLVTFASDTQFRSFAFWSLGSLTRASWSSLVWLLPWTVLLSLWLVSRWRVLNALLLGEREALHLGFALQRVRRELIVVICLLVGPLVAVTGGIAFIGLVMPHMLRLWLGAGHRLLLPMSWMGGAIALLLADGLARTLVMPAELPVGVITSLVGGPFFLWLLLRSAQRS